MTSLQSAGAGVHVGDLVTVRKEDERPIRLAHTVGRSLSVGAAKRLRAELDAAIKVAERDR